MLRQLIIISNATIPQTPRANHYQPNPKTAESAIETEVGTMTNETSESRVDEFNENHSNDAKDKDDSSMSVEELVYGASSFYAIVKPVSLTMLLSSLAVIYINTEESKAMGEEALGIYQAFDISEDQSTATSLGLSLVNALIIVTVIGAMTFLIVILYRFRCMKCLMGYMVRQRFLKKYVVTFNANCFLCCVESRY